MDPATERQLLLEVGKITGTLSSVKDSVDRIEKAHLVGLDRINSLERSRAKLWGVVAGVPFLTALAAWLGWKT